MPTYEYRCKKGHLFERLQKMSATPLRRCSKCGGRCERLIGGGMGLIFKGSGFYITDYKKKSKSPKSDGPAKTESKPSVPVSGARQPAGQGQGGTPSKPK